MPLLLVKQNYVREFAERFPTLLRPTDELTFQSLLEVELFCGLWVGINVLPCWTGCVYEVAMATTGTTFAPADFQFSGFMKGHFGNLYLGSIKKSAGIAYCKFKYSSHPHNPSLGWIRCVSRLNREIIRQRLHTFLQGSLSPESVLHRVTAHRLFDRNVLIFALQLYLKVS
jgi:hypothetical protein